jgi:hypothetical protein
VGKESLQRITSPDLKKKKKKKEKKKRKKKKKKGEEVEERDRRGFLHPNTSSFSSCQSSPSTASEPLI